MTKGESHRGFQVGQNSLFDITIDTAALHNLELKRALQLPSVQALQTWVNTRPSRHLADPKRLLIINQLGKAFWCIDDQWDENAVQIPQLLQPKRRSSHVLIAMMEDRFQDRKISNR